jgi:hypothetical protein
MRSANAVKAAPKHRVDAILRASGRREPSNKSRHALAECECDQSKAGNGDCEKETVGNQFITRPHDRTSLFDQKQIAVELSAIVRVLYAPSRMNSPNPGEQM